MQRRVEIICTGTVISDQFARLRFIVSHSQNRDMGQPRRRLPFIHNEDIPILNPSIVKCESSLPGPQKLSLIHIYTSMLYAFNAPCRPGGFVGRIEFVAPLPFNLGLVQLLADHRNVFLTKFSLAAAFWGGVDGYILLVMLFYVIWNKRLAIRLAVVALAALSLNDLFKICLLYTSRCV